MAASKTQNKQRARLTFAAIDSFVESHIVRPDESVITGDEGIVRWGKKNDFPDYLRELYEGANTFHSVVEGIVDYICGNDIEGVQLVQKPDGEQAMNNRGETLAEIVRLCAWDYVVYKGFALAVYRNAVGEVSEIEHLDFRYVRSNKENDVFFYSEDWKKGRKFLTYPKFVKDNTENEVSVLYVTGPKNGKTYPSPLYEAAIPACEMERAIDEYNLNEINNGFSASYLVNFNSGVPEDDEKKEIERNFNDKFSGHKNAGRIIFSFNEGKEAMTVMQRLDVQDFQDKYDSVSKRSRQQIFTAFRANPNLFGIPTESLGFSSEEYDSAFKLFNRTVVQPIQRLLVASFQKIYDIQMTITPFTLDGEGEKTVEE